MFNDYSKEGLLTMFGEYLNFCVARSAASDSNLSEGQKAYLATLSVEREREVDIILRSALADRVITKELSKDYVAGFIEANEIRRSLIQKSKSIKSKEVVN